MSTLVCERAEAEKFGHTAAILLSQLRYWLYKAKQGKNRYIVKRKGLLWVARSRGDLCAETALTAKQIRRAIDVLRKANLIRVEQHIFANKNISHFHLMEKQPPGLDLFGSPKEAPAVIPTNDLAGSPEKAPTGLLTSIKNLEENKKKNISIGEADAASGCKEENTKEGAIGSEEINAKISHPISLVDEPITPADLDKVYRCAFHATYPECHLAPTTAKEMGQLKNFIERVPKGKASVIVEYVVRHWLEFRSYASAHQAAFNVATHPVITQILQYVNSAVDIWQDAQVKPAKKSTWVLPQKTTKAVVAALGASPLTNNDEPMATLEEVAKMLGYDK